MMETKPTETEKVDAYMASFEHPLKDVLAELRSIILGADKGIGEEIKWNAPTFFYTGPMRLSDPKLFERYMIVSNVHPKDHIMLVFPSGDRVDDGSGLLEGDYADGRRLLRIHSLEEAREKRALLEQLIKKWLETVPRD